jgi:hypothetical protein
MPTPIPSAELVAALMQETAFAEALRSRTEGFSPVKVVPHGHRSLDAVACLVFKPDAKLD